MNTALLKKIWESFWRDSVVDPAGIPRPPDRAARPAVQGAFGSFAVAFPAKVGACKIPRNLSLILRIFFWHPLQIGGAFSIRRIGRRLALNFLIAAMTARNWIHRSRRAT
jgi:hypothetical protein